MVLVSAVLAAVAVPAYVNTRKAAAARACRANIAAVAAAQSAYATRFGAYCFDSTTAVTTTPSKKSNASSSSAAAVGAGNSKGKASATGLAANTGTATPAVTTVTTYATQAVYTASTTDGAPTGGLVGAPEGLSAAAVCPLDGSVYTCTPDAGDPSAVDIACRNAASHQAAAGAGDSSYWTVTLRSAAGQ